MDERQERRVAGLRIHVDRSLCVGFADCIDAAPQAFALDPEGVVVLTAPEAVARETLVAACAACPVDALSVWDETGRPLVPRPKG